MIPADPKCAADLARAASTGEEILSELIDSSLPFVRNAALANPATPLSAVARAVPSSLDSDATIGAASAIVSRADISGTLLASLLGLLSREHVDGARREHWRFEQLAVSILCHPRIPEDAAASFFGRNKPSKAIRIKVTAGAANRTIRELAHPPGRN